MQQENIYMLGICFAAIIFLFFAGPLKFIFKMALRGAFGLAIIYLANTFLCSVLDLKSLCIGINFISAIVTSFLGLPGIISLYVAKSIL